MDWLYLIADRVETSGAESAVALFEELQKAMKSLKVSQYVGSESVRRKLQC